MSVINQTLRCDTRIRCDLFASPICGSVSEAPIPKMWWVGTAGRYTACHTGSRVTQSWSSVGDFQVCLTNTTPVRQTSLTGVCVALTASQKATTTWLRFAAATTCSKHVKCTWNLWQSICEPINKAEMMEDYEQRNISPCLVGWIQ